MTKEEAAEILDGRNIVDTPQYLEALLVAAEAFCEDMRRREGQEFCEVCAFFVNHQDYFLEHQEHSFRFCWKCGRPLTVEARKELERRIGGTYEKA